MARRLHTPDSLPRRRFSLFRLLPFVAAAGLFLAIAAMLVGKALLESYLRGDDFREMASRQTSDALDCEGTFSTIRWDGASAYSERFQAVGTSLSPIASLDVLRIRTDFYWRSVFSGKWRLDRIQIGFLEIVIKARQEERVQRDGKPDIVTPAPSSEKKSLSLPSWFPRRFDIGEAVAERADLLAGDLSLKGVSLRAFPEAGSWLLEAKGGEITLPGFPTTRLSTLRARLASGHLYLLESEWNPPGGGRLRAQGEVGGISTPPRLQCEWERIDASEFLPDSIGKHLSGQLFGNAEFSGGRMEDFPSASKGGLVLRDGILKGLPILENLAKFTSSPQFNRLPIHELSMDFEHSKSAGLTAKNFSAESRGLVRMEGDFSIAPSGEMVGNFQIGLTPQTLQWMPGSRERVFTESRDGYLWAPMRVGGTLSEPTEDLSQRLLVAMGMHVIDRGVQVLDRGTNVLQEPMGNVPEGIRSAIETLLPLLPNQ